MTRLRAFTAFIAMSVTGMLTGSATAAQPEPWQIGFQDSVTLAMDRIDGFQTLTLWIIIPITFFVLGLLIYVAVKFNSKANPVPSRTSHNTLIEVIWTVVPVLILLVIVVPSLRLLNDQLSVPDGKQEIMGEVIPAPTLTVKATGYQWYWGYEYPDHGDLSFDSLMLEDDERMTVMEARGLTEKDVPRLLAVDYEVVVPVNETVRLIVTAADVIHAVAMPSMGIKLDGVPGRLNETWFNARKEGIYYGQCSELCGKNHAFMPIAVRVVSKEQFAAWVEAAKTDLDAANEQLRAAIKKDDEEKKVARR